MSKLVVVSNRVAPIDDGKKAAGGLAVAVLAALKQAGGGIWFGWSGETSSEAPTKPTVFETGRFTYVTSDLGFQEYQEYYTGFANSTLWPLFHYRLDLTEFNRRNYEGYRRVNSRFASQLAPFVEPDDLVWVHDYHLIPFGLALREMGLENRIGFFLHTPFPAPEILVALPSHAQLVQALCAYDVLGFHTTNDVRAFLDYIHHECGGEVEFLGPGRGWRAKAFGRVVHVDAYPISIDTEGLVHMAQSMHRSPQLDRLKTSIGDRDLMIGVDRIDYSKGLPQRFEAFDRLLETYPANRGQVVYLQIAPPSRTDVTEYIHIRQELETKAGHINGRFAEFDWQPLRYINRSYSQKALTAFYRGSRVGLVTPLRDGMNLVAKEYVACQDPDDPGVLILSRFAGAARELDAAVIVNPYDVEGVAEAMQLALTMSLDERKERYQSMMRVLRRNTINTWRERFTTTLAAGGPDTRTGRTQTAAGRATSGDNRVATRPNGGAGESTE